MKDLKKNSRLSEIRKSIPKETTLYVEKSHAIADRIFEILDKKGIDQSDLAKSLGKYESEISKWLTGDHNFTIYSLAKMEAALGEEIIQIPKRSDELVWLKCTKRIEAFDKFVINVLYDKTEKKRSESFFHNEQTFVWYFNDLKNAVINPEIIPDESKKRYLKEISPV